MAELMSPVEHTIVSTQPLGDAANLLRDSDAAVLVRDPSGHTKGLLAARDLAAHAAQNPEGWHQILCAAACPAGTGFLRAQQPVEGVLWLYRTEKVQPLPVLNGWKPVGILYPEPVFLWCAEQPDLDFPAPPQPRQ
ncbi:CBS domain-containing protein [Nesterenkonia halotolerans]|uniref:CBS domain-containing protein n=1 Tax=Nesterenkonia halotolerans TaxID=225325 RepID=A0ABR9J603_9MICC|nr:CBS domain-containing protein [Nesterenkonia halotolerans]MBE1514429.1 hypothetical protein [Nesterenkonia halotolerans]